ncbi:TadE family protein [Pedomonas mirosovicensis]|uniref:TadE family protein n=1 Tax=Pedomonas mirosovicensis TaxID=2908641 RepID=UPI00216A061C|nr:TadE/TadG family type IV pilus assembly protein [Pedomonas mirosovicensis]MCH8685525.1 pilus assembly protein [Pedomonas mirosovicensis]
MIVSLRKFLRRLRRDTSGLGVIELAFVAPILMLLMTGGLELANYIMAKMKVTRVATMMADLTAQSPVGVLEGQISDLFLAANMVTDPLNILENGRVYITAVRGGGSYVGNTILWQRCDGKRTDFVSEIGSSNNKNVVLPRNITLETDAITVVAQASMAYKPLLFDALFPENTEITQVAVYMPRALSFGVITADETTPKSNCGTNVTQYNDKGYPV